MYLLDTKTEQLQMFQNLSTIPRYAILSHTWLPADEEVLFKHVETQSCPDKCLEGMKKVLGCCQQARQDGFDYVWIDTCCIDKSSSAELSEAINSMFHIYAKSARCYAYLSDVYTTTEMDAPDSSFRKSRWFTRGWTLQELVAPSIVEFFASDWRRIGSKQGMANIVQEITGIDSEVLYGLRPVNSLPIAEVMLYAAGRQTTRTEDRAYSLLGLFGVNMATIYGEGEQAFIRLQYEIMIRSPAHSLLTWTNATQYNDHSPVLASSPSFFSTSSHVVDIPYAEFASRWNLKGLQVGFQKGPHGLQAHLPIFDVPWITHSANEIDAIMVIACRGSDPLKRQHTIGIPLIRKDDRFFRPLAFCRTFVNVDCLESLGLSWSPKLITLVDRDPTAPSVVDMEQSFVRTLSAPTGIILNRGSAKFSFVPTQQIQKARRKNQHDIIPEDQEVKVCSCVLSETLLIIFSRTNRSSSTSQNFPKK